MIDCPLCPYKTKHKGNLVVHIRTHTREKPFKCQHPQCPASFASNDSFKKHQLVHTKEKKYECSICSKKFGRRFYLLGHIKSHGSETPFGCSLCPYRGKAFQNLQRHVRNIHSDEKPYKCDQCPYKGKTNRKLTSHLKVHLDPFEKEKAKKHRCPHYPHKTLQAGDMKSHIRTHTGEKPFSCLLCDHKANTAKDLKNHIAHRHTREKKFKCKLCDYSAVTSGDLTVHIRRHTGEKPYKCKFSDCPYAASNASALRVHKLVYGGGEKSFKCCQCPYAATLKGNLRQHEKNQHLSSSSNAKGFGQKPKRKRVQPQHIKIHRCRVHECKYWSREAKGLALHLNQTHQLPILILTRWTLSTPS